MGRHLCQKMIKKSVSPERLEIRFLCKRHGMSENRRPTFLFSFTKIVSPTVQEILIFLSFFDINAAPFIILASISHIHPFITWLQVHDKSRNLSNKLPFPFLYFFQMFVYKKLISIFYSGQTLTILIEYQ